MSIKFTDRSKEAFALAVDLHKDQKRKIAKGESEDLAIPYITHLMNVASYVLQASGNEDQFIAALLHDSIEDQPHSLGRPTSEIIEEKFGKRVLELVLAATDGEPNQERTPETWKARKEKYINDLKAIATKDPEALLVPLADKLDNATSLVKDLEIHGSIVWQRFNKEPEQMLWYYESIYKTLDKPFSNRNSLILLFRQIIKKLIKIYKKSTVNVILYETECGSKDQLVKFKPKNADKR